MSKIIAVDFDGVLCEDIYPKIGSADEVLINELIERQKNGDKLILWTCRRGIYLNNAVAWCKKRGLIFDAVNENLPEMIKKFHGDSRKVYADIYIDDKNDYLCHLDKAKHIDEPLKRELYDEVDIAFKKEGYVPISSVRDLNLYRYQKTINTNMLGDCYIHCIDIFINVDNGTYKVQSYQKSKNNNIFTFSVWLTGEQLELIENKVKTVLKDEKDNDTSDKNDYSMSAWVKREIENAKISNDSNAEHINACYDSAHRAFETLIEYDRAGFSIGVTKRILCDLIDRRPLRPIVDTDDIWEKCLYQPSEQDIEDYQCKRMYSLFKTVYKDGTVKYSDVDRHICVDINNPDISYQFGLVRDFIDTVYPIKMPYSPDLKPFKVYTEDFLVDLQNDDFDTVGLFYLIKPDGKKIKINRFYKADDNSESGWKRISKLEYLIRKALSEETVDHPLLKSLS